MTFDPLFLLLSFAGGLWGGFVGALETFIFCGFVAMIGAGLTAAGVGDGVVTNTLAFGPIIGPHVSFAGGAAAAAYLAKKGKLGTGRDIATTVLGSKDITALLISGVFGVLGYLLFWLLSYTNTLAVWSNGVANGWVNPIALSIVINAIIVRLVFGKTGVFGKVYKGNNRWRQSEKGNWIPWMTTANELLLLGFGTGIAAAWSTIQNPNLVTFWFGLSAAMLLLLQFNVKVPVWHHMVLAAEQAVALGGGDLWWGTAFGVLGAFLGELYSNIFTTHGDTHIDPPSVALATTYFLTFLLDKLGAFSITGFGSFAILLAVIVVTYGLNVLMKSKPNSPETALAGC